MMRSSVEDEEIWEDGDEAETLGGVDESVGSPFDIEEIWEHLPDAFCDWLRFKSTPATAERTLLKLCFQFEMTEVWLLPDWLTEIQGKSRASLMYPVYVDAYRCMGRMYEVMGYATDMFAGAGIKVGNILEERFTTSVSKRGDLVIIHSALLDDDSVVFSRNEISADGVDRYTLTMRTSYSDPRQVHQGFSSWFKKNCTFCSMRKEKCNCVSRSSNVALVSKKPSTGESPLDFWHSMKKSLEDNFVFELSQPAGSNYLRGPSPSAIFSPRLVGINYVNLPTMQAQLKSHLVSLAQRHVTHSPSLIVDGSMSSDDIVAFTERALVDSRTKKRASKVESGTTACNTCGRTFSRKYDLQRHIVAVHEGVKSFQCNQCDRTFSLRDNLVTHISNVHERRRNVNCPLCGGPFSTAHKMRLHIRRVHLKEQPHTCKQCGYKCFQKSDLRRHMLRAHGEGKGGKETAG